MSPSRLMFPPRHSTIATASVEQKSTSGMYTALSFAAFTPLSRA